MRNDCFDGLDQTVKELTNEIVSVKMSVEDLANQVRQGYTLQNFATKKLGEEVAAISEQQKLMAKQMEEVLKLLSHEALSDILQSRFSSETQPTYARESEDLKHPYNGDSESYRRTFGQDSLSKKPASD
ncbi:hypothetical protein BDV93DRAFT_513875 [Ceratobasidium sp. AG-I]|nr:hypothetical protein BDV93DRAFT_513875 [Ceratobasidium sp. AG-I]